MSRYILFELTVVENLTFAVGILIFVTLSEIKYFRL